MVVGVNRCLRDATKTAITSTRVRLRGRARRRYKIPILDALARLKTCRSDKPSLQEELLVLMTDENEKQRDVETEYFGQTIRTIDTPETKRTVKTMR